MIRTDGKCYTRVITDWNNRTIYKRKHLSKSPLLPLPDDLDTKTGWEKRKVTIEDRFDKPVAWLSYHAGRGVGYVQIPLFKRPAWLDA